MCIGDGNRDVTHLSTDLQKMKLNFVEVESLNIASEAILFLQSDWALKLHPFRKFASGTLRLDRHHHHQASYSKLVL